MPIVYPYTQYGGIWKLSAASAAQGAGTWPKDFVAGSTYFNGSSQITVQQSTLFNLVSSNFTLEFWVNSANSSGSQSVFAAGPNTIGQGYGFLSFPTSGVFALAGAGNGFNVVTDSTSYPLNTWIHYAVVRSSGTTTMYKNGVSVSTTSTAFTWYGGNGNSSYGISIGNFLDGGSFPYTGYISNLRLTSTAVYTSNFTVPNAPLTNISGTILLTCQSQTNALVDNSSNNFTLTAYSGTPTASSLNPFY
jgi:hypothetical protein